MIQEIRFTLNGSEQVFTGSAVACLLDVLRDTFGLTSVKCGCREGECGACSVLLDGVLVNSCMVAMGRVTGSTVVTLEGYRNTEGFKILDRSYASVSAIQCGYCIPGMILASEYLLSKNPHPEEAEIRVGISGNLCRCTGYNAIVKAISIAAEEGKGIW